MFYVDFFTEAIHFHAAAIIQRNITNFDRRKWKQIAFVVGSISGLRFIENRHFRFGFRNASGTNLKLLPHLFSCFMASYSILSNYKEHF